MGSLDLAVELWGSALDVGMADALILDMPVELGLELMAVVGPDLLDAERELFDDVIDEVDRVGLCVFVVDLALHASSAVAGQGPAGSLPTACRVS